MHVNTLPIVSIVMLVLGCVFSIIAMATNNWGKLDPTPAVDSRDPDAYIIGNWGLFKIHMKQVSTVAGVSATRSLTPNPYYEYWTATMVFEILALIFSVIPIPLWSVWLFCNLPRGSCPCGRIIKLTTIIFMMLSAFGHAVAVSIWNAQHQGPRFVQGIRNSSPNVGEGFSWGFAIFCIVWELLTMIPMQLSLPRHKRKVMQPRPLFRFDPEKGGINFLPGKEAKEPHPMFQPQVESDDNALPGFMSKPSVAPPPTVRGTFLDSLPDERNVYVYDEEEATIKPHTISRTAGKRTAEMLGQTWGKKPQPERKSRLQQLKETWSKRDGLKFGFGTSSKGSNPVEQGSVSKITGRALKSSAPQMDNSTPLFVKSLWNTHFTKDKISDDYQIDSDQPVTKRWEENDVDHDSGHGGGDPNFTFTAQSAGKRKNYNDFKDSDDDDNEKAAKDDYDEEISEDEDDEEENGRKFQIPESSEDETEAPATSVPNPNITQEKKVIARKNYNVASDDDDDDDEDKDTDADEDRHHGRDISGHDSNFSFKKPVVERKNYNLPSDEDEEHETEETTKGHRNPGIQMHLDLVNSTNLERRMSDHSSLSDEMFTYSYDKGLDKCVTPESPKMPEDKPIMNPMLPSVRLEVDRSVLDIHKDGNNERDADKWAKSYDDSDRKAPHNYDNFAYLSDMGDSEQNTTEI